MTCLYQESILALLLKGGNGFRAEGVQELKCDKETCHVEKEQKCEKQPSIDQTLSVK